MRSITSPFLRRRSRKGHRLSRYGMDQLRFIGVQKLMRRARRNRFGAVQGVAYNREARMAAMNPDLMRPSCLVQAFHHCVVFAAEYRPVMGNGTRAFLRDLPFDVAFPVTQDRRVDFS